MKHAEKQEKNIDDLNSLIGSCPDNPDLYYKRGVKWSQKGAFYLALEDFSRAISLKTDFARAYYGRGTVYNFLREYEKAKKDFYKSHTLLKKMRSREDHIRRN